MEKSTISLWQKTAPSLKNRFQLTQVNYNISRCTINTFFVLMIWLMFPESVKSVFVALNKFWSLFQIRAWSPTPRFSETADLLLPTWAGFQGLLLFKPKDETNTFYVSLFKRLIFWIKKQEKNLLTFLCLKIDFIHWYRMHEI